MTESMIWEKKVNGKYIPDGVVEEPDRVHYMLMHDLIAKKLHNASCIKSIKDRTNYDGTRTITVTYDDNCRRIYRIKF